MVDWLRLALCLCFESPFEQEEILIAKTKTRIEMKNFLDNFILITFIDFVWGANLLKF